jgi:hypothetical protein
MKQLFLLLLAVQLAAFSSSASSIKNTEYFFETEIDLSQGQYPKTPSPKLNLPVHLEKVYLIQSTYKLRTVKEAIPVEKGVFMQLAKDATGGPGCTFCPEPTELFQIQYKAIVPRYVTLVTKLVEKNTGRVIDEVTRTYDLILTNHDSRKFRDKPPSQELIDQSFPSELFVSGFDGIRPMRDVLFGFDRFVEFTTERNKFVRLKLENFDVYPHFDSVAANRLYRFARHYNQISSVEIERIGLSHVVLGEIPFDLSNQHSGIDIVRSGFDSILKLDGEFISYLQDEERKIVGPMSGARLDSMGVRSESKRVVRHRY